MEEMPSRRLSNDELIDEIEVMLNPEKWVKKSTADELCDLLEEATDQLEKAVTGGNIDANKVNKILARAAIKSYREGV